MSSTSEIFNKAMKLYVGTNSIEVIEYPTFFHNKSFFSSEWYNFVIPKVAPAALDEELVQELIVAETKLGKNVSYYINASLAMSYSSYLASQKFAHIGNENYLVRKVDRPIDIFLNDDYSINTTYDLAKVIEVLELCFPEWPEETNYSKVYENYKANRQQGRLFETFCIYFKNELIGAGSIVIDKDINLAYLHNAGIQELHRRKGLHTALINYRCNYALENGVNTILSIVDDIAGSFISLQKDGFELEDKFLVFAKS